MTDNLTARMLAARRKLARGDRGDYPQAGELATGHGGVRRHRSAHGQADIPIDSTTGPAEAERIRKRFVAQVDEQRSPRTRATFGRALEAWPRTHEAEETTLDGYRGYVRRTIEPALGDVPIGKATAQVLEEFYAELRQCRHLCRDGQPERDHRTAARHDCRIVRHRRRPGRPGPEPHDCEKAACDCGVPAPCMHAHDGVLDPANPLDPECGPRHRRAMGVDPLQPGGHRQEAQAAPAPALAAVARRGRANRGSGLAQDDEWGALVWLVMVTGLRRGEVLALRWADIDLSTGMLTVRRSYVRSASGSIEKDTITSVFRQWWRRAGL
jgi:integrase